MPLQDLLTAIETHLQQVLQSLQSTHDEELATLKTEAEANLQADLDALEIKFQQKQLQLRRKTEDHAERDKSHSMLQVKRSLLDEVYQTAINQLAKASDNDLEPVWKWALEQVSSEGTLMPAAAFEKQAATLTKGSKLTIGNTIDALHGFKVVTDTQEYDFTLETIIQTLIRPATEHKVAEKLFT